MRGAPGGRGSRVGLVVVAVSIIVIVGSFLLRPDGPDSDAATDVRTPDPSSTQTSQEPSAEPTKRRKRPTETASAAGDAPAGLPDAGGLPPLGSAPGLSGSGGGVSMKRMNVHLQVFSSQPIGVVGYQVPTSLDKPSGTVNGVGTSWSLRTVAYGRPDYARLFFRAGPSGTPITCVITINGRVTERRSTSGPYGATMCQG